MLGKFKFFSRLCSSPGFSYFRKEDRISRTPGTSEWSVGMGSRVSQSPPGSLLPTTPKHLC